MARYGALAGAAAAAIGVLCSYEARVLHFRSSPGDAFKISISEVLGCKEGCCATPNPKTEMMKEGRMGIPLLSFRNCHHLRFGTTTF